MKKYRIGMIAMSGVRALNPELVAAGLTLPGFIERSRVIASLPSLSLLTLAGMTPPQFDVEYREVAEFGTRTDLPDEFDLVAITALSAQIADAYQVADHYRMLGVPVVMGGLHVTALPEEALSHCTAVAVGEGEAMWPQMLADFEAGRLGGIYRQLKPGSFDLRDSPMPRFELLDPNRYNRLTVQTSRGCPHKCSFCASSILLTPGYKTKPVPRILEEIRRIRSIWSRPFIEFADDNSFVSRPHTTELLTALAGEGIPWFTEADVRIGEDDELLARMRDAGCRQVLIGLESPNRARLDGIELRANWKAGRRDRYLESIERIQSHGITVNGCFVFGLDGDTSESMDDVIRFVRESGLYEVQVTVLTPFPGTPLYRKLKEEGRLIRDPGWETCTLFDVNFHPRGMTAEALQAGLLRAVKELYSVQETRARRRRFWSMARRSPAFRR